MNEWIVLVAGVSPTVELRARRLLSFEIGMERTGTPVTVATMFARLSHEPLFAARYLMRIPPKAALRELTVLLGRFRIDGEFCPAPEGLARAALIHAGRALTTHPAGHAPRSPVRAALAALCGWFS